MPYTGIFDFFYGMESERYNFVTIPKLLIKDARFNHVSTEAKLMYGLLLDRNALSQKNGWMSGTVYISFIPLRKCGRTLDVRQKRSAKY